MSKLYVPCEDKELDWDERFDKNWEQITQCDQMAKEAGTMVGRYIDEPYADGKAIYQIIRENKETVRIRVCTGIGDDWRIPMWGDEATIPKDYAQKKIAWRESLEQMVQSRKNFEFQA